MVEDPPPEYNYDSDYCALYLNTNSIKKISEDLNKARTNQDKGAIR